eukprot:1151094-Pelagomonas_calceolata.AAC.4
MLSATGRALTCACTRACVDKRVRAFKFVPAYRKEQVLKAVPRVLFSEGAAAHVSCDVEPVCRLCNDPVAQPFGPGARLPACLPSREQQHGLWICCGFLDAQPDVVQEGLGLPC